MFFSPPLPHPTTLSMSLYFNSTRIFNLSLFTVFQNFDCHNHIRVIQPMGDGSRLYICGTNAHNPKDWVIYVSNLCCPLLTRRIVLVYTKLWLYPLVVSFLNIFTLSTIIFSVASIVRFWFIYPSGGVRERGSDGIINLRLKNLLPFVSAVIMSFGWHNHKLMENLLYP